MWPANDNENHHLPTYEETITNLISLILLPYLTNAVADGVIHKKLKCYQNLLQDLLNTGFYFTCENNKYIYIYTQWFFI